MSCFENTCQSRARHVQQLTKLKYTRQHKSKMATGPEKMNTKIYWMLILTRTGFDQYLIDTSQMGKIKIEERGQGQARIAPWPQSWSWLMGSNWSDKISYLPA